MADFSGLSKERYQVIEPLCEGGMATVYKAYDTRLEREEKHMALLTELNK